MTINRRTLFLATPALILPYRRHAKAAAGYVRPPHRFPRPLREYHLAQYGGATRLSPAAEAMTQGGPATTPASPALTRRTQQRLQTATGGAGKSGLSPLRGVYTGNNPDGVKEFEDWLGGGPKTPCEVDMVHAFLGGSLQEMHDPVWFTKLFGRIERPIYWSAPLIPDEGTLAAAAKGDYDKAYTDLATALDATRPDDVAIIVRLGWEANGDWFRWTAIDGKEQVFIGAFRRCVDAFREVSDRFLFEWNFNIGGSQVDPDKFYPGRDHTDICGADFYLAMQYIGRDPVEAWNRQVKGPTGDAFGLQYHVDFADSEGLEKAYSEWGVTSDDAGPYLLLAADWFLKNDVLAHLYWDSTSSFPGQLRKDMFPKTGAVFKEAFGPGRFG